MLGAGEHGDLTLGGVKERVVGHETLVLAEFDDGMTSGLDFQAVAVVQLGAHVALAFGHLGQAGRHVQRRQRLGGALKGGAVGTKPLDHFVEEGTLEFDDTFLGTEDAGLVLLELRRHVAFGVGQRLTPLIGLWNLLAVGAAYFQVVAEKRGCSRP